MKQLLSLRWTRIKPDDPSSVLRVAGSPYLHEMLNGGAWKLQVGTYAPDGFGGYKQVWNDVLIEQTE